jgi:hypothetical protein
MNLIDQNPGRGSESSCRDHKNPANVTTAAASQMKTPTARTHRVCLKDMTMRPARATASPRYPTRRARRPSSSVRCVAAPAVRPCWGVFHDCEPSCRSSGVCDQSGSGSLSAVVVDRPPETIVNWRRAPRIRRIDRHAVLRPLRRVTAGPRNGGRIEDRLLGPFTLMHRLVLGGGPGC